ncbi:MAG TPA: hypothetical protein VIV60_07250 [Polyangiaceae bacterium]
MTVDLTCRLLESKALLRTEVAGALLDASLRGIALVQSLMERIVGASAILEAEFSRWPGPLHTAINADVALVQELPHGMCERLLALPLQRRDRTQPVSLAIVDPFDRHAIAEFAYCLSVAVTPVRVPYSVLLQALEVTRSTNSGALELLLDVPEDETPAFGTRMLRVRKVTRDFGPTQSLSPSASRAGPLRRGYTLPSVEAPEPLSDAPIPLVRTTLTPKARTASMPTQPPALPPARERDSEPVLHLVKQKPPISLRRVSVPPPPRFADEDAMSPEERLKSIEAAESPCRLIELLSESLRRLAPCQAYFSVRSGRYTLEWASNCERSENVRLTPDQEAMLTKASQVGYFLGPLPPDGPARALGATLGLRAREEIYVAPVTVANRAALLIIAGRFDEAFAVTRWVDLIAARASQALERLARHRR